MEARPDIIPEPVNTAGKNHVMETVESKILQSSTGLQTSDSGKHVGRSRQEKAKRVMGLNAKKSLSNVQKNKIADAGNMTALETDFQDVVSPRKHTFDDAADIPREIMDEDRVKETARDIFNGTELLLSLGEAAKWLMNTNEFNSRVRRAYFELFDFVGLDILTAVRYCLPIIGLMEDACADNSF